MIKVYLHGYSRPHGVVGSYLYEDERYYVIVKDGVKSKIPHDNISYIEEIPDDFFDDHPRKSLRDKDDRVEQSDSNETVVLPRARQPISTASASNQPSEGEVSTTTSTKSKHILTVRTLDQDDGVQHDFEVSIDAEVAQRTEISPSLILQIMANAEFKQHLDKYFVTRAPFREGEVLIYPVRKRVATTQTKAESSTPDAIGPIADVISKLTNFAAQQNQYPSQVDLLKRAPVKPPAHKQYPTSFSDSPHHFKNQSAFDALPSITGESNSAEEDDEDTGL